MSISFATWKFPFQKPGDHPKTKQQEELISKAEVKRNDIQLLERGKGQSVDFGQAATLELSESFVRLKNPEEAMVLESKAARTLKVGSKGNDVKQLQQNLNALGYNAGTPDGVFGNGTKNAVISFQKTYGLSADGIAGNGTLTAISTTVNRMNKGIIAKGQVSENVRIIQNELKTLGYLKGNADGAFGTGTEAAVKAFQKASGLTQDGLVGSGTRAKLAEAVKNHNQPKPEDTVLKVGSKGAKVEDLQRKLQALGYNVGTLDGQFGQTTKDAVVSFQKTYGLTADGQAGTKTQQAVNSAYNDYSNHLYAKGRMGEPVKQIQSDLKTLGYLSGNADGAFGSGTEAAVKNYQQKNGLSQTGKVDAALAIKLREDADKLIKANEVIKYGASGEKVKQIQNSLKIIGYDIKDAEGSFGNSTRDAVMSFQRTSGLTADGQIGEKTGGALALAVAHKTKNEMALGHYGEDVKSMQGGLITLGYLTGKADGAYGKQTEAAVKKYQQDHGQEQTGRISEKMAEAIKMAVAEAIKAAEEAAGPVKITREGINFTKSFETLRLNTYNGGETIGYGFDIKKYPGVTINYEPDGSITEQEANRLFDIAYNEKAGQLERYLNSKNAKLDRWESIVALDVMYNRGDNSVTRGVIDAMIEGNSDLVVQRLSTLDYDFWIYEGHTDEEADRWVKGHGGFEKRTKQRTDIYLNKAL